MGRKKKDSSTSMLDRLFEELINSSDQDNLIDICLSDNASSSISAVPKRFRLIALAFHKKMSPADLNQLLEKEHCAKLYVRNHMEASVFFALQNGLSYEQWRDLRDQINSVYSESMLITEYFTDSSISLQSIRSYVEDNSILESDVPMTSFAATQFIQNGINNIDADTASFLSFIAENANQFSDVRERTRYYFCKYLMYYLEDRKKDYFDVLNKKEGIRATPYKKRVEEAGVALSVFRVKTDMQRHSYHDDISSAHIDAAPLSPYFIYAAFEDYYFGYINTDWTEIILDYYGNEMPTRLRKQLANTIRKQNKNLTLESDTAIIQWKLKEMDKKELEKDRVATRDRSTKSQAGRMGETFIRDILKGKRDLDRTTLMAFLLFFQKTSTLPEQFELTEERLNTVLSACGFHGLNKNNNIDSFFIGFMKAEDTYDYLTEAAEDLALSESNFYLYKTYINSKSEHGQWKKMLHRE